MRLPKSCFFKKLVNLRWNGTDCKFRIKLFFHNPSNCCSFTADFDHSIFFFAFLLFLDRARCAHFFRTHFSLMSGWLLSLHIDYPQYPPFASKPSTDWRKILRLNTLLLQINDFFTMWHFVMKSSSRTELNG
jgi:hypothetical protein